MDEGRERNQTSVGSGILGPNRSLADLTLYTVHDSSGKVLATARDVVELMMILGSRLEH